MSLLEAPSWPMAQGGHRSGLFGSVLMSNSDHEVDQAVAQQLHDEQVLAEYSGWNFHAICWFDDGQFYAEVCSHHIHRATLSAPTPEELMEKVSNDFGSD